LRPPQALCRAAFLVPSRDHASVSSWFLTYGFAEVLDNLVIGAYPLDQQDVATLQRIGIERVLNLVEEGEYRSGEREVVEAAYAAAGIRERRLQLIDYSGLSPAELDAAVQALSESLEQEGRTYLHCRAGWQRSAAVAAAAIAVRQGIDIDAALGLVQQRKPSADPLPHQRADLQRWWQQQAAER
jgi:atypical dual specificity phosphatase